MDGRPRVRAAGVGAGAPGRPPWASVNRYPHPATPVPHRAAPVRGWRRVANRWTSRPWAAVDLVLWACIVAWACLDILTTTAGLASGAAAEGNHVGAAAWGWAGPVGLLQLKIAVLLAISAVWIAVPWQWRRYVRAGVLAGGAVTLAAVAHNAFLLLMVA